MIQLKNCVQLIRCLGQNLEMRIFCMLALLYSGGLMGWRANIPQEYRHFYCTSSALLGCKSPKATGTFFQGSQKTFENIQRPFDHLEIQVKNFKLPKNISTQRKIKTSYCDYAVVGCKLKTNENIYQKYGM